jgi:hypothetical protein
MLCSVTIRFVGQSRSYYRRRAIEYEYLPTERTEYEYGASAKSLESSE